MSISHGPACFIRNLAATNQRTHSDGSHNTKGACGYSVCRRVGDGGLTPTRGEGTGNQLFGGIQPGDWVLINFGNTRLEFHRLNNKKYKPALPVGCGCFVFEKLSNEEQDSLMSTVSSKVDSAILVHFKNLRSINDLDSIFELITRCKTSDKTVAPIYFYVVNQLSEKSDGYVGEAITGFYYDFFIEFPECAYSYLQVASQDDHKGFGFNILFEIDANETSDTYLDSAFDAHRARFGSCLAEIDSLESFILKNRN